MLKKLRRIEEVIIITDYVSFAQSAGAVEYTDCTSAQG